MHGRKFEGSRITVSEARVKRHEDRFSIKKMTENDGRALKTMGGVRVGSGLESLNLYYSHAKRKHLIRDTQDHESV